MMIALALMAFVVSGWLMWNAAHRRHPIDDLRARLAAWIDGFEARAAPPDRGSGDDLDDLGDTLSGENGGSDYSMR